MSRDFTLSAQKSFNFRPSFFFFLAFSFSCFVSLWLKANNKCLFITTSYKKLKEKDRKFYMILKLTLKRIYNIYLCHSEICLIFNHYNFEIKIIDLNSNEQDSIKKSVLLPCLLLKDCPAKSYP